MKRPLVATSGLGSLGPLSNPANPNGSFLAVPITPATCAEIDVVAVGVGEKGLLLSASETPQRPRRPHSGGLFFSRKSITVDKSCSRVSLREPQWSSPLSVTRV